MVLRLLAFNAEAWLAEHPDAYLADPDEYRATARHLLHLGGKIDYTITLDRLDSPPVARALQLLTDELNATPATMPGDHRPLTYQVARHESQRETRPYLRRSEPAHSLGKRRNSRKE